MSFPRLGAWISSSRPSRSWREKSFLIAQSLNQIEKVPPSAAIVEDPANAGIRRKPELPEHEEIVAGPRKPVQEFEPLEDEPDDEVQRQRVMQRNFSAATRQAPLDRADDLGM
jgi:hypothetical protein